MDLQISNFDNNFEQKLVQIENILKLIFPNLVISNDYLQLDNQDDSKINLLDKTSAKNIQQNVFKKICKNLAFILTTGYINQILQITTADNKNYIYGIPYPSDESERICKNKEVQEFQKYIYLKIKLYYYLTLIKGDKNQYLNYVKIYGQDNNTMQQKMKSWMENINKIIELVQGNEYNIKQLEEYVKLFENKDKSTIELCQNIAKTCGMQNVDQICGNNNIFSVRENICDDIDIVKYKLDIQRLLGEQSELLDLDKTIRDKLEMISRTKNQKTRSQLLVNLKNALGTFVDKKNKEELIKKLNEIIIVQEPAQISKEGQPEEPVTLSSVEKPGEEVKSNFLKLVSDVKSKIGEKVDNIRQKIKPNKLEVELLEKIKSVEYKNNELNSIDAKLKEIVQTKNRETKTQLRDEITDIIKNLRLKPNEIKFPNEKSKTDFNKKYNELLNNILIQLEDVPQPKSINAINIILKSIDDILVNPSNISRVPIKIFEEYQPNKALSKEPRQILPVASKASKESESKPLPESKGLEKFEKSMKAKTIITPEEQKELKTLEKQKITTRDYVIQQLGNTYTDIDLITDKENKNTALKIFDNVMKRNWENPSDKKYIDKQINIIKNLVDVELKKQEKTKKK